MTNPALPFVRRRCLAAFLCLVCLGAVLRLGAAEPAARKNFSIGADDAAKTLEVFSEQAGAQLVYVVEEVRGVKTNAVTGALAPKEALDQMLAGTALVAAQDAKNGALVVRKDADPNAARVAQSASRSDRPPTSPTETAKPLAMKDDTFQLDPFEVSTSKDTSYGALNSNSITRFNTELDKTPVVADIFTEDFMHDTGVTTLEDLYNGYATGAGQVLATPESDGTKGQPGDRYTVGQYGQRGLSAGTPRRDGFQFNSTQTNATDLFDTERVESIHGSQGLLYGATGAGGVINLVSKQARFNKSTNGNISERIDQYGSKRVNLDMGLGGKYVALRFDALQQDNQTRALYIGDNTQGFYGQLAFRLPFQTTLRLSAEGTHNNRESTNTTTVNLGGTTVDPRSGDNILYLLATHRLGANDPVTGAPYAAGAIDNGHVTDRNARSWAGWVDEEDIDNGLQSVTLDTVWTPWLSTSFGAMYGKQQQLIGTNIGSLSPGPINGKAINSNPLSDWAISSSFANSENADRKKQYRAAVLFTNDLFGDRVHSQTSIGFDRQYDDNGSVAYQYYKANADGSPIMDLTKSNLGRSQIPTSWWSVADGPLEYPYFKVGSKLVNVNGVLYTRMPTNPRGPQWVTPNNPQGLASLAPGITGVSGNNNGGFANQRRDQGYYFANYSSWFHDKFFTMLGFRESDFFTRNPNTSAGVPSAFLESRSKSYPSYNAGLDYRLGGGFYLYGAYSRTFNTISGGADPYGNPAPSPTGYTYEGGLKYTSPDSAISGSLSAYSGYSKDDNANGASTFQNSVNAAGLNGRYIPPSGISGSTWARLDKTSQGLELVFTAAPTPNWRMRFSANAQQGVVKSDSTYKMLYNDQFFVNGAGTVTYGNNGPAVMVPTDATSLALVAKQTSPIEMSNPANTAYSKGTFVPLTLAMINDPGTTVNPNPYYAFGQGTTLANEPVNGSIGGPTGGSQGTQYLKNVLGQFQFNGVTPLTGVTGLPFSAMQYNFADPANLKGQYLVYKKGDHTVGAPAIRINLTNTYQFSQGMFRGFGVGGSLALAYYGQTFYYRNTDQTRHLFSAPLENPQINAWLSYQRKFRRVTWRTQVNVNNLFNRYTLVINPNNTQGFQSEPNVTATFYGVARSYSWTNTFSF